MTKREVTFLAIVEALTRMSCLLHSPLLGRQEGREGKGLAGQGVSLVVQMHTSNYTISTAYTILFLSSDLASYVHEDIYIIVLIF